MRYKLAACGCLTDDAGYVMSMCSPHMMSLQTNMASDGPGRKDLTERESVRCSLGHLMTYDITDNRFHCQCGAVASAKGTIIVDPDPVETKHG